MRSSRLRSIGLLIGLLSLSACGRDISSCPPLASYSDVDQAKAADELEQLPKPSVLERMITDYGVTRAQLRTCQP